MSFQFITICHSDWAPSFRGAPERSHFLVLDQRFVIANVATIAVVWMPIWWTFILWLFSRKMKHSRGRENAILAPHSIWKNPLNCERHTKKKTRKFCVNRGDKLLCFYTNVAFENIGFRAFYELFCFHERGLTQPSSLI